MAHNDVQFEISNLKYSKKDNKKIGFGAQEEIIQILIRRLFLNRHLNLVKNDE
jgi:hypothetical protein